MVALYIRPCGGVVSCLSAYEWGHPGDKQLTLYGFHIVKDAEDGRHGTVYISMYMMKGALYYVSRDTPVEFTGWLCNNKTASEMLRLTEAAVRSCYEICDSILCLTGHSMQHNV